MQDLSNKDDLKTSKLSYNFPKEKRLITAKDYQLVFNHVNLKIHQPHIMCLIAIQSKNPELTQVLDHSRLGLAISKAKNKHAHERNRIKRLIREYFRLHQHELVVTVDMVFLAKKNTNKVSNKDIYQELENCWKKINRKLIENNK